MIAVQDYTCLNCGSGLSFKPELQKWKCDFCHSEFEATDLDLSIEEKKSMEAEQMELDSYECNVCGAVLLADANTSATFCVYCKNPAIIKTRFSGKFKPDKLIPFKITEEQSRGIYRQWIKRRRFAPKTFRLSDTIMSIKGIYTPYWLFDGHASGKIEGEATRVRTWTSGDHQYTETKFYAVERDGTANYKKLPVDAVKKLDDALAQQIEPYVYNELIDFSLPYISGFMAERYDVDTSEAQIAMEQRAKAYLASTLKSRIKDYSTVKIKNAQIEVSDVQAHYAIFPLYMIVNQFKGKTYTFLINGQTGKISGETPIDVTVQLFYGVIIFVIGMLVLILGGALFV